MYLNSESAVSGRDSFRVAPSRSLILPASCRAQACCWYSVSLRGLELVERQDANDPGAWQGHLPGKLSFVFVGASHAGHSSALAEDLCGSASIVFIRQSVDRMRLHGHALELRVDETRFREELSRYLDRPAEKVELSPTLERARSYEDALYVMVKSLRDLYAMDAHPTALRQQGAAILTALVQGPFHNHWHDCMESMQPLSLKRVHTVTRYIHAHLKDNLTLDDLIRVAGCGARSLQISFDKHLGQSPLKYLRIRRLEAAHRVLSEGGRSVTEVAYDYGFSNPGRFAKAFQERFGKRPSDICRKS